ncbi:hypothetical protein ACHHYP_17033 [Achlya hypogyna]|uniref:Ribosomal protein L1 n=1 Tax=Achlya hypogyna TaxID=1202772 RepID=A0A1V9ZDT7_ACHHY|nr:hypothetical protein ACHHYP_17033 [Achlya hypogyna]
MERLDRDQVQRAVVALKQFVKKQEADKPKKARESQAISLVLTRQSVPATSSPKPIPIALPHSMRDDGDCVLFVKDADLKRIKEALKKDPVPAITKVMGLKKIKEQFTDAKERRELYLSYATFLVDERVLTTLKTLLGKGFFDAKKQPFAVQVSMRNVGAHVRQVLTGTTMVLSTGPCINVKVAHHKMPNADIVDNVMDATELVVAQIGKKWKNVKSLSIKTAESVALPVYGAPGTATTSLTKKRKTTDVGEKQTKKAKQH